MPGRGQVDVATHVRSVWGAVFMTQACVELRMNDFTGTKILFSVSSLEETFW